MSTRDFFLANFGLGYLLVDVVQIFFYWHRLTLFFRRVQLNFFGRLWWELFFPMSLSFFQLMSTNEVFQSTSVKVAFCTRQLGFYFNQCLPRLLFGRRRLGLMVDIDHGYFLLTSTRIFGWHRPWLFFLLTSTRFFSIDDRWCFFPANVSYSFFYWRWLGLFFGQHQPKYFPSWQMIQKALANIIKKNSLNRCRLKKILANVGKKKPWSMSTKNIIDRHWPKIP